jgi:hypothetical protein
MSSSGPRIVVVTPVRNEAWILDRFLAVTSRFADRIIIADQQSTDASSAICERYSKVTAIPNGANVFNEAERQVMLVAKARDLVPGHKILLALDADEILAANCTTTPGWRTMLAAPAGTVICFPKVELYDTPGQCILPGVLKPFGFVDDGSEHLPKTIHSLRLPLPEASPRLYVHDVNVMHYRLTRLRAEASKRRFYSVLENVLRTNPRVSSRRLNYPAELDYTALGRVTPTPNGWFEEWEAAGIDMRTIETHKYFWWDHEVLRQFREQGTRRFWMDDIWSFDWETCRQDARARGIRGMPDSEVVPPPRAAITLARGMEFAYHCLRKMRNGIFRPDHGDWS